MDRIVLYKGDITKMQVCAIVNAANQSLLGGGGVDGAIHRAAGPGLIEECRKLNGCNTGEAKITKAYNLPGQYIIHTVGPVWNGGKANEKLNLTEAYRNSLKLAVKHEVDTIAFPNISTGVYGFPKELAAKIAIKTVREFLKMKSSLQQVFFCVFDEENYSIYERLLLAK